MMDTRHAESRLAEWSQWAGVPLTNPYPAESVIARMMSEGPGSGSGRRGGSAIPALVYHSDALLSLEQRVREVASLVGRMPEDWRQVVRLEYLEGKSVRLARTELEWHERKWLTTRATMLGWLAGKLEHY